MCVELCGGVWVCLGASGYVCMCVGGYVVCVGDGHAGCRQRCTYLCSPFLGRQP